VQRDIDFAEVADALGLSAPAFAEKDYFVVQALKTISQVQSEPFEIIFAGGTCLTKAHEITNRMSEDVDLKVLSNDGSMSRNGLKKALRNLRKNLITQLKETGFELTDSRVHSEGKFFELELDYKSNHQNEIQLRPHILIEVAYRAPKIQPIMMPIRSFAAEALGEPPEANIQCVTVEETASEKLVALLWRVFAKSVGEGPDYNAEDERLVRHVYDLYMIDTHVNRNTVVELAREVVGQDAKERAVQSPKFASDPESAMRLAANVLKNDKRYMDQYEELMNAMVYGAEPPTYENAINVVAGYAHDTWGN